jgi:hypothetical protein
MQAAQTTHNCPEQQTRSAQYESNAHEEFLDNDKLPAVSLALSLAASWNLATKSVSDENLLPVELKEYSNMAQG